MTWRIADWMELLEEERKIINIFSGDSYEIDEAGEEALSELSQGYECKHKEIFNFMRKEGIICNREERRDFYNLQFHLWDNCNLRCSHCYDPKQTINKIGREKTIFMVKQFAYFCWKMGMSGEIDWTGGEIMTDQAFMVDLFNYVSKMSFFINQGILTNGTITPTEVFLQTLKKNNIRVQFSIDGDELIHNSIRGKGVYAKVITNIQRFKKFGITPSIHFVFMRKNKGCIEDFVFAMDKLGIKNINFSNLIPIGPGAQEEALSAIETKELFEEITELQKKVDVSIVGSRPPWPACGSIEGYCPIGYKTLTISASGDFMPCRRLDVPIGHINHTTFFQADSHHLMQKFRNRKKYFKVCGTCEKSDICSGCRASAMATTGDLFKKDPTCWL